MKILSINAGSSSLKFSLHQMPEEKELVIGTIEEIGTSNSKYKIEVDGESFKEKKEIKTHEVAVDILLHELIDKKVIENYEEIKAVGHRVVHGGEKYSESIVINDEVIKTIDELSALAPLHNPANLTGIKAFKKVLPNTLNVAVFDTAFHQTMKKEAYMYAVPYEWYTKYGVRKYGFHGTSHRYISNRISEILGKKELKVISCHLGNGGSLCAIKNGESVDTTMGFTPLAGIPMGTRSGDIDPSIIEFIMKKTNKTISEVINDLNKNSGFLGVSGESNDNRDIEDLAEDNHERAELALSLYVRSIVDYISAYNTLLEGADVICFAGGIGENAIMTRGMIIKAIAPLGVIYHEEENDVRSTEKCITDEESKIPCYIIETDEEILIARDTYDFVK